MKKIVQPLVHRWRQESSGVIATGSLAVVMAAMIPLRAAFEADRHQAMRLLRHSRFTVDETLQRIELAARDRGLSVLAFVPGMPPVLVLAASIGGAVVVMNHRDSRPAMPMGLMVSAAPSGGADVLIDATPASSDDWPGLPASVLADLRDLPSVVERAVA
jgi:hypothetical protein